MQQMMMGDYVNERPRRGQKHSGDANQTKRRLFLLLLLSFGVLCVIQAVLNVALRLTLYSSKKSTSSVCNTTHDQDKRAGQCNRLQERFNALTRDKNLLENRNSELNNVIKNLQEERDRLKMRLKTNQAFEQRGSASPQRCPADWTEINFRCYFLSTEMKTWQDSRRYCQGKNADLVVISSEQEQMDLRRLSADSYLLFWIGLSDTSGTNNWKWVDGSALTDPFWQYGQPESNPTKVEGCVETYHRNPPLASWNDAPCGAARRWLCEKDS